MYTLANMQESIKKVEATRAQRMANEPRRMTADEKDALLAAYHPDYKEEGFITLKVGPNKGEKVPTELGYLLESNSRILGCLLYTSPSPRDRTRSRMPSSA